MNTSAILASDLMQYDWLPWWLCCVAPDLSPRRILSIDKRCGLSNFLRHVAHAEASHQLTERCRAALGQPNWPALQRQLAWVQQPGQTLIHYNSPHYPPVLRHTQAPPPLLWVCGNMDVLYAAVAMVGSRRPSFCPSSERMTGRRRCRHSGWWYRGWHKESMQRRMKAHCVVAARHCGVG